MLMFIYIFHFFFSFVFCFWFYATSTLSETASGLCLHQGNNSNCNIKICFVDHFSFSFPLSSSPLFSSLLLFLLLIPYGTQYTVVTLVVNVSLWIYYYSIPVGTCVIAFIHVCLLSVTSMCVWQFVFFFIKKLKQKYCSLRRNTKKKML